MSEYTLQFIAFGKILWVAVFSLLYGLGGVSNKWIRRYIGPAWMTLGVFVFSKITNSFHFWYLAYGILLMGALHLGYGGDDVGTKIRKRSIYGLALGISAAPLLIGNANYILFGCHLGLCCFVSIVFGVFNPTRNAREEEGLIAFLSTLLVLFLI